MTHAQKIADYRAALEAQIKLAEKQEASCRKENATNEENLWWGHVDGLKMAIRLSEMLD